ncbi:MAG: serine hydrolase [Rhodothermales bacterium]|nr:serine hydrolase [Rhodothermales bacterium]
MPRRVATVPLLGAGLLVLAFSACRYNPESTALAGPGWPAETWPVSTPAAEGFDPDSLAAIEADVAAGVYGSVDHFLLIRNGRAVIDTHYDRTYTLPSDAPDTTDHPYNYSHPNWHPYYHGSDLHTLQSVTKSVNSAALGIAIDAGLIPGVESPVMPYLQAYSPDVSDPRKAAMTIEDLLTMRSGIDWYTEGGYGNTDHSTIVMELSDEWIRYIIGRPMDAEPGTVYEYNDGASVLLGKIITEATGMRADLWAAERLFKPIGITEHYWKITPDGETDTEGGLYLKTHDLARIGYLFLRGGEWEGKQIVSKAWVDKSTAPVVADIAPANEQVNLGYGYQWWVPDQENGRATVFAGNGYGGQFVLVAPDYDIVAVFNAWDIDAPRTTWRLLQDRILPSTRR